MITHAQGTWIIKNICDIDVSKHNILRLYLCKMGCCNSFSYSKEKMVVLVVRIRDARLITVHAVIETFSKLRKSGDLKASRL